MYGDDEDFDYIVDRWVSALQEATPDNMQFQCREIEYQTVQGHIQGKEGIAEGSHVSPAGTPAEQEDLIFEGYSEPYDDGASYLQEHVPESEVSTVRAVDWKLEHDGKTREEVLTYVIHSSFNDHGDTVTRVVPNSTSVEFLGIEERVDSYIEVDFSTGQNSP